MAVNGNSYPCKLLGPDGQVFDGVVTIQFTDGTDQPGSGSGGLAFTGWTEDDNDPADVVSNGGSLDLGNATDACGTLTLDDGTNATRVDAAAINVSGDTGDEQYRIGIGGGFSSTPPVGVPGFSVSTDASGTIALDCGGLSIVNPSVIQDDDGDNIILIDTNKLGFFNTPAISKPTVPLTVPTVQDVIDALVAYGLLIQSD